MNLIYLNDETVGVHRDASPTERDVAYRTQAIGLTDTVVGPEAKAQLALEISYLLMVGVIKPRKSHE